MLSEIELGDRALEYIKEELANGDAVAKTLLQKIIFEHGVIRTYLPDDVIIKETLDFQDSIADDYQAMFRETHKWVADFITAYLSQKKNNIAVFETLASPSDPCLQRIKLQYFSKQQDVYILQAIVMMNNGGVRFLEKQEVIHVSVSYHLFPMVKPFHLSNQ